MVLSVLRFAWRALWRDLRGGELRLLALALAAAVASVTSVGFFTDRVGRALTEESHQLLGADLLLTADHPWRPDFAAEAERRGLTVGRAVSFPSMVLAGEATQLVEVKAVSDNYPLRGALRWAPRRNAADREANGVPPAGEAWVDARVLDALALTNGDRFELGNVRLKVSGVITLEPDRGSNVFALAPRVMINLADLEKTQLIQVGSRASFRLLLAGPAPAIERYVPWARANLGRGERLEGLDNARPELRQALQRAESYLGLTALLAAVLAAVAVAMAARRFNTRHLDGCAVMRCLGATQARLAAHFAVEFSLLGLLASAAGGVIGFVAHWLIAAILGSALNADLPAPSVLPLVKGFATGLLLLLGFAMPPILRLRQVPALRVLRREWSRIEPVSLGGLILGLLVLAGLLVWQAGDGKLSLWVLGGLSAAVLLFFMVASLALRLIGRRAGGRGAASFGLVNAGRRGYTSVVQVVALALGLTSLLLLAVTRGDLIEAWRDSAPPGRPNRFIVGIQPPQTEALRQWFSRHALSVPQLYPMVRGRLMAINGEPIDPRRYADRRAQHLAEREFNMSWASELSGDNRVTAGRWFNAADHAKPVLSVEASIAETLGIEVGDALSFSSGGQTFTARVVGLRSLEWESMRPNFYVLAPPGLLDGLPTSYMCSVFVPVPDAAKLGLLVRDFPNLTVIDIAAILEQVHGLIEQVIRAVEFVFGFALLAGILVLYAALFATQDERVHEAAVLRVVGARRRQLLRAHAVEYAALGALAGALAGVAATAIAYALYTQVFELSYRPNHHVWWIGPLAGLLAVAIAGWQAVRLTTTRPPLPVLRAI